MWYTCVLENFYFLFRGGCTGKFVHVNDMKAYRENRIIAQPTVNQMYEATRIFEALKSSILDGVIEIFY